jgi:DNA invertase Pin-like site-specific DNA recombinase
MLALVAQRNLEAWRENDAGRARDTIIEKIGRLRYSHPDSKGEGKSFSSILKKAGLLETFMTHSLQTEIAKWVLLRDVLHDDRKNKKERRSDDGLPIQFRRTLLTELARHLEVIEEAVAKYECLGAISTYYSLVTKEFRRNAKALISYRQPRLWRELLGESELEVTRVYRDKMSGTKASRPELDELMADARKRRFDVACVWRFDRFARSVSHLLQALESFRTVGIEFVSISEQVDTSSPAGKLVFTVLGAVAELERSLIVERVRMGLQSAIRKGRRLGRPPIRQLNPEELANVKADRATGKFSLRRLAEKYRTSVWAMQQATMRRDSQILGNTGKNRKERGL